MLLLNSNFTAVNWMALYKSILTDYLKDMFSSHYAAFLLNFGMSELLEALG